MKTLLINTLHYTPQFGGEGGYTSQLASVTCYQNLLALCLLAQHTPLEYQHWIVKTQKKLSPPGTAQAQKCKKEELPVSHLLEFQVRVSISIKAPRLNGYRERKKSLHRDGINQYHHNLSYPRD